MNVLRNVFTLSIIIVFILLLAIFQSEPTGQAIISDGGSSGNPKTIPSSTVTTWPGNCGRPCSLAGGIGILDINDKCIDIKQYYDEKHCCVDADCGDEVCNKGICVLEAQRFLISLDQ